MRIRVGFDLTYESAIFTPMILMLNVHPSRSGDLIMPDKLRITPTRAISRYIDGFGNKCVRILAPPGELRVTGDTIVSDSGKPDPVNLAAEEHAVANLPHDTLGYLLGSRYCETDIMMDILGRSTRLAKGVGDLRFCSRLPHFRLPIRESN